MYLHKELETLTRPEIEKLQLERLQKTVRHCMNSPFYKQRFAENHLSPEDIRSLDDLQKIPFTTKQDLRDTYPFGLASVPLEKTVRLHSSSGTTGNPTVILHTQKDLDEWANAVARCLYMVGLRPGDVFQNSSGYGMFTGGLGFQYGAERLGMLTVPAAPSETPKPVIPFCVTNNPGTCWESTGNNADSLLASICSRSITEIVSGTLLRFTCTLFAEITTPCKLIRLSIAAGSLAKTSELHKSPEASKITFFISHFYVLNFYCYLIVLHFSKFVSPYG